MKRTLLWGVGILAIVLAIGAFFITRDGETITPEGSGTVTVAGGTFEAFPLPDYVGEAIDSDYKSYLVEVEPGIKMHVLEVGEGYPVYLQHGNPTNGLLYRKVAAELPRDRFRLIMPTLVGLGFSTKIPASEHQLDNHLRWTGALLDQLQLKEVIYVGQDWGGPVGMGALSQSPDLLKGAVIMNTGLNAPREQRDLSSAHATAKTPIVGELLFERVVSIFDRLAGAQGDPASIPPEVSALYGRPVTESGNFKAPLAMMRMVPDSPDHPSADDMQLIEDYIGTLDVPVEIVWGTKDPILGPGLATMKANFPNARVTETQAGHFLQEEVPGEIAEAVMRLYDAVEAPEGSDEPANPD